MRFRVFLVLLLLLTPITSVKADSGYDEIHGGKVEIALNLVDRVEHEVAIFKQSHFVLEITEEESSAGCGEVIFSTLVSKELVETGKTKVAKQI